MYTAFKKDGADVSKIYVQVKITVPKRPAEIDELAPKISRFANSQNKVNAADFSTNHVFHRQLQERSRTIWAPATDGSQQETRWFYERARGQYLDEKSRAGTPAKQKVFEAQHPTHQKFTKTDLAKFENSWFQLSHLVSRGAEKNFVEFMARMGDGPAVNVDAAYFQQIIAKAILFRESEKIVHAQQYGGYRADIVTYLIAWLSRHTAQRLDHGDFRCPAPGVPTTGRSAWSDHSRIGKSVAWWRLGREQGTRSSWRSRRHHCAFRTFDSGSTPRRE